MDRRESETQQRRENKAKTSMLKRKRLSGKLGTGSSGSRPIIEKDQRPARSDHSLFTQTMQRRPPAIFWLTYPPCGPVRILIGLGNTEGGENYGEDNLCVQTVFTTKPSQ